MGLSRLVFLADFPSFFDRLSASQGACAPTVSTYTEKRNWEQVMNSLFFFSPPKQMFVQGAGRWILPMTVPSGAKQCTP